MKSQRSLRLFSNTLTAAGLALAVSACSTIYKDAWNQKTDVPNLNDPAQRSQALLAYCQKLHNRGDLNLAAGICNRAHEIDPTNPAPLVELGRVLEALDMKDSAEEAYRAALLLDPEQTDALYGLGKIYIDRQRYDLALEPLQAAAQAKTEDPRIYNALGVIMDQQGQHADAQAYYHEGLNYSPRNVSLRNNLGLSMVLAGQPEQGLAMLRDVAAEPAAGATTGRNLEMASQIAAKNAAANLSATGTADTQQQTAEAQPSPHEGALWPSLELSDLSPSASEADKPQASASEPVPLLNPYTGPHMAETAPATMLATAPRQGRSLDQEMAEAMTDDPATQPEAQPAAPQQTAALPEPKPDPDAVSGVPRDWSLAAQAVFANSRAAVPEPAPTTPQDGPAAGGTSDATPAVATADQTPTQSAAAAPSDPHGDLAIAPASTAESASPPAAVAESYPADEDVFYTAQLASFRTAERAREGWQILKNSAGGLLERSDAFIVRADLGPDLGIYYRVRAGTMNDQAAASRFCQDLQAQGVECMPVTASWQETNATLVDKICQTGSTAALCRTSQHSETTRPPLPQAKG